MKKQRLEIEQITSEKLLDVISERIENRFLPILEGISKKLILEKSSEFINTKEVCKMLQITPPTLSNYRKHGIIPFFRIGNKVRFKRSQIIESLKKIN